MHQYTVTPGTWRWATSMPDDQEKELFPPLGWESVIFVIELVNVAYGIQCFQNTSFNSKL